MERKFRHRNKQQNQQCNGERKRLRRIQRRRDGSCHGECRFHEHD